MGATKGIFWLTLKFHVPCVCSSLAKLLYPSLVQVSSERRCDAQCSSCIRWTRGGCCGPHKILWCTQGLLLTWELLLQLAVEKNVEDADCFLFGALPKHYDGQDEDVRHKERMGTSNAWLRSKRYQQHEEVGRTSWTYEPARHWQLFLLLLDGTALIPCFSLVSSIFRSP